MRKYILAGCLAAQAFGFYGLPMAVASDAHSPLLDFSDSNSDSVNMGAFDKRGEDQGPLTIKSQLSQSSQSFDQDSDYLRVRISGWAEDELSLAENKSLFERIFVNRSQNLIVTLDIYNKVDGQSLPIASFPVYSRYFVEEGVFGKKRAVIHSYLGPHSVTRKYIKYPDSGNLKAKLSVRTYDGESQAVFGNLVQFMQGDGLSDLVSIGSKELQLAKLFSLLIDNVFGKGDEAAEVDVELDADAIKRGGYEFIVRNNGESKVVASIHVESKRSPSAQIPLSVSAFSHVNGIDVDSIEKRWGVGIRETTDKMSSSALKEKNATKNQIKGQLSAFAKELLAIPMHERDRAFLLAGLIHRWLDEFADSICSGEACFSLEDYNALAGASRDVQSTEWKFPAREGDCGRTGDRMCEQYYREIRPAISEGANISNKMVGNRISIYVNNQLLVALSPADIQKYRLHISHYDTTFDPEHGAVTSGPRHPRVVVKVPRTTEVDGANQGYDERVFQKSPTTVNLQDVDGQWKIESIEITTTH